jgi:1-aminocyclopropane-1-carboxylate deaminase
MLFTEKLAPNANVLQFPLLKQNKIEAEVLRLDEIDPVVSGNKWFKLKEYVEDALKKKETTIITFGGAFSNHILATAAFCKKNEIAAVGIIRGEKPKNLSITLKEAIAYGMDLFFLEREKYKQKEIPAEVHHKYPDAYVINEGGYGILGAKGASNISHLYDTKKYTHILTAVGTGTTLAGLTQASGQEQQLIGVSAMKNNFELERQINHLLTSENKNRFHLCHQFHFGGYAKYNKELIDFMNDWYTITGIPSDFVYTGKMFYGFHMLLQENYFPSYSKILLIHTGGLQGNNSLKKGTLIF